MQPTTEKTTILTTKLVIRPEAQQHFVDWQAKLHSAISAFPGFASLEISSPTENGVTIWVIVQRFHNPESTVRWQESSERQTLMDEIKRYLVPNKTDSLQELKGGSDSLQNEVTEVFVTQVAPDKEETYRQWIAKMHQVEAGFPGFKGVYVQSPTKGQARNWITFLKFDSQENLDRWLNSRERENVLQESKSLIDSLESHRIISPYAGWFASASKGGEAPPVWKQTMIILLVLFPIVMLELKFLSPLTSGFNISVGTFISNAVSVTLLAWPVTPIAIRFLRWWLIPNKKNSLQATLLGTFLLIALYLIEIIIFWNLL